MNCPKCGYCESCGRTNQNPFPAPTYPPFTATGPFGTITNIKDCGTYGSSRDIDAKDTNYKLTNN